jgi:cullin-associated NEDD8-dissociated protein 1
MRGFPDIQVTQHSSAAQLESIADLLWIPLFDDKDDAGKTGKKGASADEKDLGDDGIRNVKAACIGKLTTTAPAKYLPQLQVSLPVFVRYRAEPQRLISSSARNKAMVAAAVRYTFIDTSSAYDELIAPIIVDFLSLMHDENVVSVGIRLSGKRGRRC